MYNEKNSHVTHALHFLKFVICSCTFEEGELLKESRGHKGVSKTEEEAAEQQPCGADVDGVRSGAHKTHRHLQRSREFLHIPVHSLLIYHKQSVSICAQSACEGLSSVYLRSQVEVTVHRQYGVCIILGAEWKQLLAGVLEVFLQEELSCCSQEKMLAVRGADILWRPHGGGNICHLEKFQLLFNFV